MRFFLMIFTLYGRFLAWMVISFFAGLILLVGLPAGLYDMFKENEPPVWLWWAGAALFYRGLYVCYLQYHIHIGQNHWWFPVVTQFAVHSGIAIFVIGLSSNLPKWLSWRPGAFLTAKMARRRFYERY